MYLSFTASGKEVYFVYSAFHELVSSLHTLSKPSHHESRFDWAEEKLSEMPQKLKDQLSYFSGLTDGYMTVYDFELPVKHWEAGVLEVIDHIEALEDLDFCRRLVPVTASEGKSPDQRSFGRLKNDFVNFMKTYYVDYMLNDIAFSEPVMIRHIKREYERAKEGDLYKYIEQLHPRIEVTENRILFHKYKLFDVEKEVLKRIIVHCDSYVVPHLLMGIEEDEVNFVTPVYLTSHKKDFLPTELLDIFKGLGDGTRLNIVKHLYRQPMTTQKLADRLLISEPGVSKQLKRLHKAGIVFKERDGNYIRYHLNQQVIDSLVLYMYEFLE